MTEFSEAVRKKATEMANEASAIKPYTMREIDRLKALLERKTRTVLTKKEREDD